MELSQQRSAQPYGLLYPLMLMAAIAVIVFSVLGIATIAGWMPGVLSAASVTPRQIASGAVDRTVSVAAFSHSAFDCGECGVPGFIRDVERGGAPTGVLVAAKPGLRL